MKYLIVIVVTFFIQGCSSVKNLEKIENHEVVFILFEESEISTRRKYNMLNTMDYSYHTDKNKLPEYFLKYSDYDDLTDYEKDVRKKIKFNLNSNFLIHNRKRIITNGDIEKFGFYKIMRILNKARTIFLIDKGEIRNGEMIVRQVKYGYYSIE